ncbi:MAG: hypothetical protein GYB67_08725, partial [Chloroflexi bacterium]|nr:hypothetical protein [Chloroflexota bacterium]
QAVIALLLAPWYLQERLLVSSGYGGTTGGFDPGVLFTDIVPTLIFGETLTPSFQIIGWLVIIALPLSLILMWRQKQSSAILLGLLTVMPIILLSIAATRLNIFTARYVLVSAPAMMILLTGMVITLWRQGGRDRAWRVVSLGLFVGLLGGSLTSLSNYQTQIDYAKSPDWRALVAYLGVQMHPDDLVVQAAADEAFTFYFAEYDLPGDHIRLPANPTHSRAEIAAILAERLTAHHSIWRVAQTFSDWPSAGIVEDWLADHAQLVRSTEVNAIPVRQYMPLAARSDEISTEPLAVFGDLVELVGVHVPPTPDPSGDLPVRLYWQPLRTADRSYKIFLHLIGAPDAATGSPLWSQDDQFPQDGRVDTQSWQNGEVVRDVYSLPIADVPAGRYDLVVGFYDPATLERLRVIAPTDGLVEGDSFTIQPIALP